MVLMVLLDQWVLRGLKGKKEIQVIQGLRVLPGWTEPMVQLGR